MPWIIVNGGEAYLDLGKLNNGVNAIYDPIGHESSSLRIKIFHTRELPKHLTRQPD